MSTIFPQFKTLIEIFFKTKIIFVYSNGGGEFNVLRNLLATHGIQHLNTPPHTHQHNGTTKRCHKHIIDTGLTLLHQAKLSLKYWHICFSNNCIFD